MIISSSSLHHFYGLLSKRKRGISLPAFTEQILWKIQAIPLDPREITHHSWLTVPPGSHEVRSVVLKGKVGMRGKQISTTPRLGHY